VLKRGSRTFYLCLLLLVIFSGLLRVNIGAYGYAKDEAATLTYIKKGTNTFSKKFIFKTKRPPLQYQVAQVLHVLGADLDNEFVMRFPYALAGFISTLVLFLYINRLTANPLTAVAGALLFAVNGFTVGLGKIVQYHSFVMLFSAISLYLFHSYSKSSKLKTLVAGVLAFSVGFYFHWDMVYIGPIILVYFLWGVKKNHVLAFLLSTLPLLLLYLVPYVLASGEAGTAAYLSGRAGFVGEISLRERLENYRYIINLYNPFIFLNFFVFVCFSLALNRVLEKTKKIGHVALGIPILMLTAFFTYQSYMLFVDLEKEYPWQRETFFNGWETVEYTHENSSRYMIGFPINRYFKEAATELRKMYPDYEEFTFDTNENNKIAEFYLELDKDASDKMFLFAVKDPASFVVDTGFGRYRGKEEVLKLKNEERRTMNKVYVWYKEVPED